jgi:hypothetical protein
MVIFLFVAYFPYFEKLTYAYAITVLCVYLCWLSHSKFDVGGVCMFGFFFLFFSFLFFWCVPCHMKGK